MFRFLSLDLRSIGLFRIGLGILLLSDLFSRLFIVNDFYTDWGAIPRAALISELSNPLHFSVFNMAGKNFYIYFLCLLAATSYLCLTIGYKTKLANFFAWIFFVSFSARAPILSHGGDDLIRLSLFWLFFLPSEAYFSFDHSKNTNKIPAQYFNFASLAFMLQLIAMYFFTALLKTHPRWLSEGSAIYYSLELDQFLTSFGLLLRDLAPLGLLKLMTQITYFVELIFPLFLLAPLLNSQLRKIVIVTFIIFHFGLFMVFNLGTFPWICMLYWIAMIPSSFWTSPRVRWIESYFDRRPLFLKDTHPFTLRFYNNGWLQGCVVFFMSIAMFWNIAQFNKDDQIEVTGLLYNIGSVLRLHQTWNMFAPYPILDDGWIIVEGNLMNGKTWDVFNNQPFTTEKPTPVSKMFPGTQWRKYLYNISTKEYSNHLLYFGRYVCRRWNFQRSDEELVNTFKVYYMMEKSRPPGELKSTPEKVLIWDHDCFSKEETD